MACDTGKARTSSAQECSGTMAMARSSSSRVWSERALATLATRAVEAFIDISMSVYLRRRRAGRKPKCAGRPGAPPKLP